MTPADTASEAAASLTPVGAEERISALDVIRGFALLGILAMNIVGFAFHPAVYGDPTIQGGATGVNLWVYVFNSILVDGKMRGIFSLCFGAGVILLASRAEQRGAAATAADIHYRRLLWLMLFGILHAFFLWWGDILYPYALLGLVLYPFRRLSPRALLILAAIFMAGTTLFMGAEAFGTRELRDKAVAADAALAKGQKLTEEQTEAQRAWKEKLKEAKPDAAQLKKSTDGFGGGYLAALKERAKIVTRWHSVPFYAPIWWDILCMMLFGMALMKAGVLAGGCSYRFYVAMTVLGLAIGIPLHVWAVRGMIAVNFDLIPTAFYWTAYEPARSAVCVAYVAVLIMIVKAGALRWITGALAAVGQMAFTNYIVQSVICSLFFYGYGLGFFARLERHQIYYLVVSIWLLQLTYSPLWLRRFRFGPLEWCWRSLTYWQRQPMRLAAGRAESAVASAALPSV